MTRVNYENVGSAAREALAAKVKAAREAVKPVDQAAPLDATAQVDDYIPGSPRPNEASAFLTGSADDPRAVREVQATPPPDQREIRPEMTASDVGSVYHLANMDLDLAREALDQDRLDECDRLLTVAANRASSQGRGKISSMTEEAKQIVTELDRAFSRKLNSIEIEWHAKKTALEASRAASPTPPPDTGATPPTGIDLESSLNTAREEYMKAKKALEDVRGVKGLLSGHLTKASKATVEQEFVNKEAEYKRLRAEYVAADANKFFAEKDKMLEAQMAAFGERKGVVRKMYDKFKGLNQYNLQAGIEAVGEKLGKDWTIENRAAQMILKAVNVRTATSFALLGVGVYAGGGAAVGWGAIAARRLLSGTGAGVATYDLLNMGRMKLDDREVRKDIAAGSANWHDLDTYLARMESRAILDGQTLDQLKSNELYNELLNYRKTGLAGASADNLAHQLEHIDINFKLATDYERGMRKTTAAAGLLVGVTIGSGLLARLLGNKTGLAATQTGAETTSAVSEGNRFTDSFQTVKSALGFSPVETPTPPPAPKLDLAQPLPAEPVDAQQNIKIFEALQQNPIGGTPIDTTPPVPPPGIEPSGALIDKTPPVPPDAVEAAKSAMSAAELKEAEELANRGIAKGSGLPVEDKPAGSVSTTEGAGSEGGAGTETDTSTTESGKLEMRAGASLEAKGDGFVVHVGSRGIEGALLDLKDAQPEVYGKMLAQIKALDAYSNFKGNDAALIHKYIADYASEHGYTIGDNGPKDLSRIVSAGIGIDSEGKLLIGDDAIKFMEPSSVKLSSVANTETGNGPGVGPVQTPPTEDFLKSNIAERLKIKIPSITDAVKEMSDREAAAAAAEASKPTALDMGRLQAARSMEKTSYAMQHVWGDRSDNFVKGFLKLSNSDLDRVGSLSSQELMERAKTDPQFAAKYKQVINWVSEANKTGMQGSVKDILINTANNENMIERTMNTTINQAKDVLTARLDAADSLAKGGKITEGLRMVLRENYDKFMKEDLKISARGFNQVKEMTIDEFLQQKDKLGKSFKLAQSFKDFGEFVAELASDLTPEMRKASNVGELVYSYAREIKS